MDAHNGIGSGAEAILPIKELPKLLGLDKMQENNIKLIRIPYFEFDNIDEILKCLL